MNRAVEEFLKLAEVQPIKADLGLAAEELFPGILTDEIIEQRMAIGNFGLPLNRNTIPKRDTSKPPKKIPQSNDKDKDEGEKPTREEK